MCKEEQETPFHFIKVTRKYKAFYLRIIGEAKARELQFKASLVSWTLWKTKRIKKKFEGSRTYLLLLLVVYCFRRKFEGFLFTRTETL